jgi:DNA-binding NarL/FixJ family response regulator
VKLVLIADTPWVRSDVKASMIDPESALVDVEDPRKALDTLILERADAALIDMQVGSMGGMALTRQFKDAFATGKLSPIPLVVLLDRSADAFLAKRAGADASLLKPFTAQEFRATLQKVIQDR